MPEFSATAVIKVKNGRFKSKEEAFRFFMEHANNTALTLTEASNRPTPDNGRTI